jgi:pimeloyl-ACP methyl ester carboxylesterase
MKIAKLLIGIITIWSLFLASLVYLSKPVLADESYFVSSEVIKNKVADPLNPDDISFQKDLTINYQSGLLFLSGQQNGPGGPKFMGFVNLTVIRPDGSIQKVQLGSGDCSNYGTYNPIRIESLFQHGLNTVQVAPIVHCPLSTFIAVGDLYIYNFTDGVPPNPSPSFTPIPSITPQPTINPTSTPSPSSNPSPTPNSSKVPLIIIPGFGGSELQVKNDTHWSQPDGHGGIYTHDYKAGEEVWLNIPEARALGNDDYFDILRLKSDGLTPEADLEVTSNYNLTSYGPMVSYFLNNGYTLNKDLFYFSYDWRKDLSIASVNLDQRINDIKTQTGSPKVDIVAHSMGGLISRSYISDPTKAQNLRKLVTLGTPYLGSLNALNAIIYGQCQTKRDFSQLSDTICLGLDTTEVKDVMNNLSGGYQLIPSSTYYNFYNNSDSNHPIPFRDDRDIDKNGITGPLNYDQTKTMLSNLSFNTNLYSFTESIHKDDSTSFNTNGVDTTFIVGSGEPTLGQIVERNACGLFCTNIPIKDVISINGDDTTPLFSGSLSDNSKNLFLNGSAKLFYTNLRHEDLPSDNTSLDFVRNILNNNSNLINGISTTPFSLNGTEVSVHSPVNIDVYDSQGNHTGLTSNGDIETNIPGSSYQTVDDAKFIWLPTDGQYTVRFNATGQGSFTYKIRKYSNDNITRTVSFNNIPLQISTTGEEDLNTTAASFNPIKLDLNGDGVVDQNVSADSDINGSEYDQHSPEAKFEFNPNTKVIELTSDPGVTISGDSGQKILTDKNGNKTIINMDVTYQPGSKSKKVFHNITYNGEQTDLTGDRMSVDYKLDSNGKFIQLDQIIVVKDDIKLQAHYDPQINKTTITTKDNGQIVKTETKDGVINLILKTQNGKLLFTSS